MIDRRSLLKAGAGAALAAPFVLRGRTAAATTRWKAYTYLPSATKHGAKGLQDMFDRLKAETDGELDIRLNIGGSLPIKGSNITQAAGEGIIDIAADGFFAGAVPVAGILRLPMLIQTETEFEAAYQAVKPLVDKGFERQGVLTLGHYLYPKQVFFGRGPITSLADVQGLKVRVTSPEQGVFVERCGGVPLTIPTPDVATSLERGVVDAIMTASIGGGVFYRDLLASNYRLGVNYFESVIIVNQRRFDRLSADLQEKLKAAAFDAGRAITRVQFEEEPAVTADLAKGGMTVTEAVPEDATKASSLIAGYWGEWAASRGPDAEKALAAVRDVVGR
ncbi:TRAP transporter substrate-binding protein DctP [Tistrella mobilis]|uniref:TRAP transporter substrate-binding protein DctP n=1 Tax=Tistrella mobilis TaxID=171437 RepID=UPI003555D450